MRQENTEDGICRIRTRPESSTPARLDCLFFPASRAQPYSVECLQEMAGPDQSETPL